MTTNPANTIKDMMWQFLTDGGQKGSTYKAAEWNDRGEAPRLGCGFASGGNNERRIQK